jgi:hypothetical protein
MDTALIASERTRFHQGLLARILGTNESGVPTNADKDSRASVVIARRMLEHLHADGLTPRLPGQSSGNVFEQTVAEFVRRTFLAMTDLRPGRWSVEHVSGERSMLSRFSQYAHLEALDRAAKSNPELATALGSDYFIKPDIVVFRQPEPDDVLNARQLLVDDSVSRLSALRLANSDESILHASISCKWTLRSDRAQNARSEGLNLVKNRKGPLPHVVVVTGEPLPARISSLALGTGELDMVYHFALPELVQSLEGFDDGAELLRIMIEGRRLRDISDLPLDLAL